MSKGLMNSVIHNKGWHGAAILSDKSELGYLYPTPRICAAAHILGYVEFRNMRSMLLSGGRNRIVISRFHHAIR